MERNPRGGHNVPPPPARRSGPAAFSFEQRHPSYPDRAQLAPPSLPRHSPGHADLASAPENFAYEKALKPRELFDPHRNVAHAEWLRGQLKEVREATFSVAALTMAMGALMTYLGSQGVMSRFLDPIERGGAGFVWAMGQAACMFAGLELKKALQKKKMGLSSEEE